MPVGASRTYTERATRKTVAFDHRASINIGIPIAARNVAGELTKSGYATAVLPEILRIQLVPFPGLFRPHFGRSQPDVRVAAAARGPERFACSRVSRIRHEAPRI